MLRSRYSTQKGKGCNCMFFVGQQVECVGWKITFEDWLREVYHPIVPQPKIGEICTVSNVYLDPFNILTLELVEYPHKDGDFWMPGFHAEGFRPLVKKKTDISVFTELLNKIPTECV